MLKLPHERIKELESLVEAQREDIALLAGFLIQVCETLEGMGPTGGFMDALAKRVAAIGIVNLLRDGRP